MPSGENLVWSIASVVLLLAGVGFLVWGWAFLRRHDEPLPATPARDPLASFGLTPSQRGLGKYLLLVVALFAFQVLLGGFTAHYTVEGQTFYGVDISQWFPYSLPRTWHIQSALFWIATGFLAVGLFLAPLINGGRDPKFQKLGVDVLFWALVFVCVGSFVGNYLAIAQVMPPELSFWLGHQGYEYVDFTLLVLRYVRPGFAFNAPLMKTAFGGLNAGLVLMIATSLLPIGIIQFLASASEGLWYARSEEFMQQPLLHTLRWVRTFGDVVFIGGALAMAWQVVLGLTGGRPAKPRTTAVPQVIRG